MRGLVCTSLKKKVPYLLKALDGYFSEYHRFMIEQALLIYDHYQREIKILEERIERYLSHVQEEMTILASIPGIDCLTASIFIIEVGNDMTQFLTAGHFMGRMMPWE